MNRIALFDAVAYLKSAGLLAPEYTLFEPRTFAQSEPDYSTYSHCEPDYGTDSPCDGYPT
jgi:hypothetical protein